MPASPIHRTSALFAALSGLALAAPAPGQNLIPEKNFYVTDNVVETVEVVGDSVYVGGHFQHVGLYTGPLAPVSLSTGATLPNFPEANDYIFGLASDGNGGWFVGGDFTEIGGVARNHVAHILADGTVDPDWDANANHRVYGFEVHDSSLYMHGFFNTIGGVSRDRLASVSLATGALTDWNPDPENGGVDDFHLDGDILYVVGTFDEMAGEPRRMAAFDLTTGELTDFDPVIGNDAEAVVAKDGVVYVGGRFTSVGGTPRNRLAAFDTATSALLPWDPNALGTVHDLALADSTLFAVGAFSFVGGALHRSLAEISLTTGEVVDDLGGSPGSIFRVLVHGDTLVVGGNFVEFASQDRRFLGAFDRSTGEIIDLPQPLHAVNALAAFGDTLFVGGEFSAVRGIDRRRFAAFHANTLELLPWAPEFQNIVWEIKPNAGADTLYVSGRFVQVNGTTREKLASFDLASGELTSFAPSVNGDVYDISVTDSLLYLGGTYSAVDGAPRADLACVDRRTGVLTPWNPGASGFVTTILAWNDTVYVGGAFQALGDSARTRVGAVDGTTGEVLGWGSSLDLVSSGDIESFFALDHPAYPNGVLFMGGDFLNLGIGLRRGVAALHRNTGNTLYNWNPGLGPSFETEVREFALADGLLYLAGDFEGVLFNGSEGVAAVDLVTGDANPWIVNVGQSNAIAVSDSMVFVGGNMSLVQGYRLTHLAAFRRDTEPPLPASSLTATPGTTDKRIDLAWSASPSGDLKDYLVYRTFTAGGDTTGRQIAATAQTTRVDIVPAYGEWFYRVYARDHAHNLAPASNEDSAVAPMVVDPEPTVVTSIHQNPALSQYADVVVVSDSVLVAPPDVAIVLPNESTGTDVPMAIISGAASAYRGAWEFTVSGVHTVQTSVTTAGGGPYDFERQFTASLLRPAAGGEARSPNAVLTLRVPAGVLREDIYFLLEDTRHDGAAAVRVGPPISFEGEVVIELAFDAAEWAGPAELCIARLEGGAAAPLPSDVLLDRGVVQARVDRLGEFLLVEVGSFTSGGPLPLQLALHPNHPNPFRGTTSLGFDLPQSGRAQVAIYDVEGRRVAVLRDGFVDAGRHTVSWDGRNGGGSRVAAGVYFARVMAAGADRSRKIVVLR